MEETLTQNALENFKNRFGKFVINKLYNNKINVHLAVLSNFILTYVTSMRINNDKCSARQIKKKNDVLLLRIYNFKNMLNHQNSDPANIYIQTNESLSIFTYPMTVKHYILKLFTLLPLH